MIRTLTASTNNVDDLEAAAQEIRTQIDPERNLLKNSIGIIACHYEFAKSEAVKAIAAALPFECAGTISSANGTGDGAGELIFSILVITSDTVSFKTVITPSLRGTPVQAIEKTYKDNIGDEKPSLIFTFAPYLPENSGDVYVDTIGKVSGGVPCFGTLAVDDTLDYHECYMLCRGEHYSDRMSMIFVFGEINPQFYLATISKDKILGQTAIITSSDGHVLKEVNGRPVVEYFANLGLTKASETHYAMSALPFVVDYNDGTPPVAKVFVFLNEKKEAVCAGAMPEGSTLSIGVFDKEDVLFTSRNTLRQAIGEAGNASGFLIFSCIARGMTLGSELLNEMDMVRKEMAGKIPFLIAFSGGEICPTKLDPSLPAGSGNTINRFHNNTFILCSF